MRRTPLAHPPRKQHGAAAIEFALVFVIFFAVFYGLVTYSVPLLMMQSFNNATAEAVRQSVAINPGISGYNAKVISTANAAITSQLAWLPPAFGYSPSYTSVSFNGKVLQVRIDYPKSKLTQVLPVLTLPGIGELPNLPSTLSSVASLQLAP